MWEYDPEDPSTVQHLFDTSHEKVWSLLLKQQKEWPVEGEDIGIDVVNPPRKVSDTCTIMNLNTSTTQFDTNLFMWILQGWLAKADKISGLAPLLEGP